VLFRSILEAVTKYMEDNPKILDKTYGKIANKFSKEHDENNIIHVIVDKITWEIYCTGKNIISRIYKSPKVKANITEKSITVNTLRSNYIPKAKTHILSKSIK